MITFTINGKEYEPISYTINEESTPIQGGDSSGAVSTFDVTLPDNGDLKVTALHRAAVKLEDTQYGSIEGMVDAPARSDDAGTFALSCISVLGYLSVFNVTAPPMSGTLSSVIRRYIDLADPTLTYALDVSAAVKNVAYIGWTGELWYHLKMLAAAHNLEISLIGRQIQFRDANRDDIETSRESARAAQAGNNEFADKAEAYWYKTGAVTNASVYPPHKDLETAESHIIPAGLETEIILQLACSVSSVNQPVFRETVSPTWFSGSNISLTAENGKGVTFGEWSRGNGFARVEIQDDPTTVKLIVRGPTGVPGATNFRLGVAATTTHDEYSSIRLTGTGVNFVKNRVECLTGVKPGSASGEMAPTYDNIFITDEGQAWDKCRSIALKYSVPELSTTGTAPTFGLTTTTGFIAGMRIFDEASGHYFRVRTAKTSPESIGITAEYDTKHSDAVKMYAGMTYGDVAAMYAGKTYTQVMLEGVDRG